MKGRDRSRGGVRRGLFVTAGAACVAMGAVGIVVPGLPTTVFLLLASYLFARSSPRLHRRLLGHRWFGPYLAMARDRAMPLRAKVISLVAMWCGVAGACVALARTGPIAPMIVAAAGVAGTSMLLLWVRTRRPVRAGAS